MPRKSFATIIETLGDVYRKCEDQQEALYAQRQAMKLYYSYIYQFLRVAPLKETIASYKRIRAMMREQFPGYLKNPYAKLSKKSGNRFYARFALWGSVLCEKLHLMRVALFFYHLISQFAYIPV